MINQIGFMITGIGIGTALAVNGAVAHAFNDVIFKGLLFMTMGSVLRMTGRINGSDLGGLYKTMPLTAACCIVGAASISAFPLFSGFVSKSMVMAATLDAGYVWVWPALLFASAGVFHHAGIKIPYFAFFGHDSGIRTADPPRNMLAAMFIAASLCIVIGVFPERTLYRLLPFATAYTPFDVTHVVTQTQLLFFGALAFVALQKTGIYPAELRSVNLDADWLWRRAAPAVSRPIADAIAGADHAVRGAVVDTLAAGLRTAERSQGLLARSWPTGSMVLWVAVLLAAYLLLHLV
jgi:multicomponent Na+:H+ antiporter subunit D